MMRKLIISVIFGLICFFGSFTSLFFSFIDNNDIYFVWSIIFPLLITLAWGYKYGIISLSLGFGGFYMFFLRPFNGLGNIAVCLSLFLFIIIQNIDFDLLKINRPKCKAIYFNISYLLIHFIIYFTLYPFLLHLNSCLRIEGTISSISIHVLFIKSLKQYINYLFILVICDVLLLLPPVRSFFRLKIDDNSKYNTLLITFSLFSGWIIMSLIIFMDRYLTKNNNPFPSNNDWFLIFLLSILYCIIGDVLIRMTQKHIQSINEAEKNYKQYRDIFETIIDIYFEMNLDGIITQISPSVEACLGYLPKTLIGSNFFQLLFYKEQKESLLNLVLNEYEIKNYEVIIMDKRGQEHVLWINLKLSVGNMEQKSIIGTMKDMTWYIEIQRMHRANEEIYKNIFDKLIIAFSILRPVFDKDGNIIDLLIINANPAMIGQIGMSNKVEFIGRLWSDVFRYGDMNYYKCVEAYNMGTPVVYEYYDSKEHMYFHVKAFKINDYAIGLFFENISSYKNALRQLKTLNMELENRVLARTEALQNAVSELEIFSHTISHDLKSPLRAIDAYQCIILEDYRNYIPNEMVDIINCVRDICQDTIDMINKLLQFAATTNANLFKESINLEKLFNDVFEQLMAGNLNRKIDFIIKKPLPTVMADKIMIRQVIENILSNAIKFTRKREHAIIEIKALQRNNEYIISVKDNGVGFDMTYVNKLFGIFERLHNSQEYEGSGIGLAIIQKIIQKHGGNVKIIGHKDKGTSICFTIPIINSGGEKDV